MQNSVLDKGGLVREIETHHFYPTNLAYPAHPEAEWLHLDGRLGAVSRLYGQEFVKIHLFDLNKGCINNKSEFTSANVRTARLSPEAFVRSNSHLHGSLILARLPDPDPRRSPFV